MTLPHALGIFGAGIVAGTINTVVGSGTLFTFPDPARVRLCPGDRQRVEHGRAGPGLGVGRGRLSRGAEGPGRPRAIFSCASAVGGIVGAILLLSLPPSAFKDIVPAFIVIALVLIVLQPRISRVLRRIARAAPANATRSARSATAGGVRERGIRRLLRRRPGDPAAGDPRAHPPGRGSPADQRGQGRAGGLVNLMAGRGLHVRRAHRVAGRAADRDRLDDRWRARCTLRPAPASGRPARADRRRGDLRDRQAALTRPLELRPGALDLGPRRAALHVIVDQAHRLHERVNGGRPDEPPAAALELLGQRARLGGVGFDRVAAQPVRPRLGSKRHTKPASEPPSATSSTARRALLITASILPRWRTIDASAEQPRHVAARQTPRPRRSRTPRTRA